MMMPPPRTLAFVLCVVAACDPDTAEKQPAPQVDAGTRADAGSAHDAGSDAGPSRHDSGAKGEDAGHSDDAGSDAGKAVNEIDNDFGFVMRTPQTRTIPCTDASTTEVEQADLDFVCTYAHGGKEGTVYIRSTPTACTQTGLSPMVSAFTSEVFFSSNGKVEKLADVSYDIGGNHRNDHFTLTIAGTKVEYFHSSFGFGYRACQPADCLQVFAKDGTTVAEDGCTAARTLPVTCVAVMAGMRYDASALAPTFAKCPGDPNL